MSLSTWRWGAGFLLLVCLSLISWKDLKPAAYDRLEADYLDSLAQAQVAQSAGYTLEKRIAIIDIDEASLDALGPWPWPRHLTAQLIRQAKERYHPLAIGVDIVFPDTYGLQQETSLRQALALPGVVLAQAFDVNPLGDPPQAAALSGGLRVSEAKLAPGVLAQLLQASGHVGNAPQILEHLPLGPGGVSCVGHITPQPAKDGVIRHIAPVIRYQQELYPMLTLAMLRCAGQGLGSYRLFLNAQGVWQIPWTKSLASYTVISAKDLLTQQLDPNLLEGRYLLIGSSALGIGDRVATPLGPVVPGVMVHAQILSHLLDQAPQSFDTSMALPVDSLAQSGSDHTWLAWLYSVLLAFGIAYLLWRLNLFWALVWTVFTSLLWLVITWQLYAQQVHTSWILPWVTVLLVMFFYVPLEWTLAQARNRVLMRRLGVYLAPDVLKRLLAEGGSANLHPSRRTITVLFVDIANFTALSEVLKPEILGELTQAVLSELTESIHAHSGTLDKYMGDAVMAIWGAPLEQLDQADLALECALDMQARVAQRAALWAQQYGLTDPISVHVGINTGEVVVGEMGSVLRRTYTAIGDAVNIAARLQEQAKIWAHPILVGEASAHAMTRHQLMRITALVLRGKHHPEAIYSLSELGHPKNLSV